MSTAYLDGADIFGRAVSIQHVPTPSAQQINSYFGIGGTQLIYGGSRGRTFHVKGVLLGDDLSVLTGAEATLLSYADGIARVLTDTLGRNWPYVVFLNEYTPDAMGPRPTVGGWALPYRATFRGLL